MKRKFYFPAWTKLFVVFSLMFYCASYAQKPQAYQIVSDKNFGEIRPVRMLTLPDSTILYRVNAGGTEHTNTWAEDSRENPNSYVNHNQIWYNNANGAGGFFTQKSRVNSSRNTMEWDFPVLNENHIVALYFAESAATSQTVGSRVFDVEIEGRKVLDDFDIMKFTGAGRAVVFYISVFIEDNNVDIDFITEVGSSLISAIEIGTGALPNMDPFISYNTYGLDRTVREGTELRIPLTATDFDSPDSVITLGGEIIGGDFYTMVDYGGGKGELIIRPGYDDAGEYLFYVESGDEDGGYTDCNACWAMGNLVVVETPVGNPVYRVNAGDWRMVEDTAVPWEIDSFHEPSAFINSDEIHLTTASHTITSNPTDAPDGVFYKSRVSVRDLENMEWNFPVPNGNYTAKLYFVDSKPDYVKDRIFDVLVEGDTVLNHFNILSEVARNTPIQKNIPAQVTDGNLTISFDDLTFDRIGTIVAAIEIVYEGQIVDEMADHLALDASAANKELLKEISVYPNPVENVMVLKFPDQIQGKVEVRLIDSSNQVRYKASNDSDVMRSEVQFLIDSSLPSGVYHAEISDGHSRRYVKVLKR
ncbi:T9SS type A sorting domain-containing protein [Fulvivirga ulvae]|uniref:malectin domain-containing carbohydrate-binding protein n=1 Tax=Fulvivirga ulvae TaxID=2904245 RepID=UPI001EEE156C|nr:malectin domain-containing carbohydrate-binding protein [Fulvivirga ulvae]UII29843.1 T9SS type A sorting domain-containing protein [Fulvivirga ulvae]